MRGRTSIGGGLRGAVLWATLAAVPGAGCDPLHGLDDPAASAESDGLPADADPDPAGDAAPDEDLVSDAAIGADAAVELDAEPARCPGAPDATVDAAVDPGPLMPIDARQPDCQRMLTPPTIVPLEPHPPSLALAGVCGPDARGPSNYTQADPEGPYAVHVVAVRKVAPAAPDDAVQVHVRATDRPAVLVLASRAEARWVITREAEARIAGVVTAGPLPQAVEGSPVAVQHVGPTRFCAFGEGWEARYHSGGEQQRVMIAAIRDALGQRETSFQGCSEGLRFEVPYTGCPETTPPVDPPPMSADATAVLGCDDIAEESVSCMIASISGIDLVGLDSGRSCAIDRVVDATVRFQPMAWQDGVLWRCTLDGLVYQPLDTLRRVVPQVLCTAVTEDSEGFLATRADDRPPYAVHRFDDAASLLAGRPSAEFTLDGPVHYLAARDGIVYASYFSTDHLERYDTTTRQALPPLVLDGFDGTIRGFDVLPDEVVLLAGEWLLRFDRETGAALGRWRLGSDSHFGLACRANP